MPSSSQSCVERARLSRRQEDSSNGTGNSKSTRIIVIIVIIVVALLSLALVVYIVTKNRKKTLAQSKYTPGENLLTKFTRWRGGSRGEYSAQLQPNASAPSLIGRDGRRSRTISRNPSFSSARNRETDPETGDLSLSTGGTVVAEGDFTAGAAIANTTAGGVDRNTSVRSVMTLPAYTPAARASEQTLAREGERGGIDVVLEFPESIDEEEQRRDQEMESLYQIRRARRQEQAEREERRVARREARARGDQTTLQRLQAESRRRAETAASGEFVTSAALIAEHQALQQSQERRVSEVQYGNIGVARADGSRVRAGSTESDNRPLLGSAASISGMSLTPSQHTRGHSASSILSVSTRGSSETHRPDNDGFEFISLEPTRSLASSISGLSHLSHTPSSGEDVADMGFQLPAEQPPEYEDAPAYTSPIATRPPVGAIGRRESIGPPRLPILTTLPSIEITAFSPISRDNSTVAL